MDSQGQRMSITGAVSAPPPGKRKEIYKYEAPWTVYSMNWSVRPDKRFRLALGSFVEEYNNKVKNHYNMIIGCYTEAKRKYDYFCVSISIEFFFFKRIQKLFG